MKTDKKNLLEYLRFDKPYGEFELLEAERSAPRFFSKGEKNNEVKNPPEYCRSNSETSSTPVSPRIKENEERLKREFFSDINPDILFRRFLIGDTLPALAVCINGMASGTQVNDFILRQAMRRNCIAGMGKSKSRYVTEHVFSHLEAELTSDFPSVVSGILVGKTAVFLEGDNNAIMLDTRGYEHRGVGVTENEKVVRGPQEGFNESIRTNVTLLRRIIKTPDFVCEFKESGGENGAALVIAYRADVVSQQLLTEVKRRLGKMNAKMLLNGGTIEQLTERHRFFPLPQALCTERPDRTAAHIMQGHVAVMLEGSPSANIVPATFFTLMSTSEDAYMRKPLSAVLRVVRYIGAGLSVILPGYFMATALHHPGIMSTEALTTLIEARRMVVFPLGVEMLFLLWIFQLLREAGIRVPGSAGQAIGIIGGLILGQAAVAANMVSTVVLIFVALAGLGTFTIPDYSTQLAAEYFRLFFFIVGWLGGLLGLSIGALLCLAWLASMKSYGVPFLSPSAPKTYRAGASKGEDYMNTREEKPDIESL